MTVPPPASGDAYSAETVVHSADEIKDMVAKIDRAAAGGKKPSENPPPESTRLPSSAPTSIVSREDLGIDVDMSPSKSNFPVVEPTLESPVSALPVPPELVAEEVPEQAGGGVNQGLLFVLVALAVAVGLGLALWR